MTVKQEQNTRQTIAASENYSVPPVPVLPHRNKYEFYAALDLGTNNCRLLIAQPTSPGRFRVVDSYSSIVRLGEGLSQTGRLNANAVRRTLEALNVCRAKLSSRKIAHQRLVTTAACRNAQNGAEFVRHVQRKTGLALEIIDSRTEARLAVSGCGSLVDRQAEIVVLFDIGGGSSEIVLLNLAGKRSLSLAEHIVECISLPIGVVTLAEQFQSFVHSREGFMLMKHYVVELLADFTEKTSFRRLPKRAKLHLLGASGTMTMLAGLALKLHRYNRNLVDGMWLESGTVTMLLERLLNMNMEEKLANPCIGPGRADLILAGCAIMEAIRSLWPAAAIRVADRGLREGVLMEMMTFHNAWRENRQSSRQAYQNKRKWQCRAKYYE